MKNLLWCSVHTPTNEQELELLPLGRLIFLQNLNPILQKQIEENPDDDLKIMSLVIKMLELAYDENIDCFVEVGGCPKFQHMLNNAIQMFKHPVTLLYSYSERIVVETEIEKHIKFIRG
jgi:hypothetical protein